MRLYIEGHAARRGYVISRTWSDDECRQLPPMNDEEAKPVRFINSRRKAFALVSRWNRRFATH